MKLFQLTSWLTLYYCLCLYPSLAFSEDDCMDGGNDNTIVLTLESSLSRALNYNRQILNTQDSAIKANYQVSVAFSDFDLQIKPNGDIGYIGGGSAGTGGTIGTGIEFSKKFTYGTKVSITPSVMKAHEMTRTNVKTLITQPLLRGFGKNYALSGLRGAQFGLRTATRNYFIAQTHLIVKTVTSLYDVLKSQKNVILNEESYNRVKKFYQAAQLKAKIGLSDPLDTYRAEIEMRQAEDALEASLVKLQESEDAIRDLLALPPEMTILVDIPTLYSPLLLEKEEAVDLALKNRVEFEQAQDQLDESRRLAKLAEDKLWPELNLVLNYSHWGLDQVFTYPDARKRQSSWGVGFTTAADFNPAADRAAYDQSLLAIEIANRGVEQSIATLTYEVKRSLRHLERTLQRIELQKKQIASAEGELRLAQIKFDRGMGNNFDLIQAEKGFRNAELSYWNALIDHIVGEYQLRETLGLLLEKPCL